MRILAPTMDHLYDLLGSLTTDVRMSNNVPLNVCSIDLQKPRDSAGVPSFGKYLPTSESRNGGESLKVVPLENRVRCVVWGVRYADDAGPVARSCRELGLTVSGRKTESMRIRSVPSFA